MSKGIQYRIVNANGLDKYAGTDMPSWFNLEKAQELVNRNEGEKILAYNMAVSTTREMWEVC